MSRPQPRRQPAPDPARIAKEDARLVALREDLAARLDRLAAVIEAKRLGKDFRNGRPLVLRDICTLETLRAQFAPDDPCLVALASLAVSQSNPELPCPAPPIGSKARPTISPPTI